MDFADEVTKHRFCDVEIGNDAVFHGTNGNDITRRTPEHFFCVSADRFDLIGYLIDRDDRRL